MHFMWAKVLALPCNSRFKRYSFSVKLIKNVRSSIHSVNSSNDAFALTAWTPWFHPEVTKNAAQFFPYRAITFLCVIKRSLYSMDSSSHSTLNILCCWALGWIQYMIFMTGVTLSKLVTFAHMAYWWMMQWYCRNFGKSGSFLHCEMKPVCRLLMAGVPICCYWRYLL